MYSWRVPLSVGNTDLKFASITEFGPVGQSEGAPTIFHWNLFWSIGWVLIYPMLALFFLLKPNRNRHAAKLAFLFVPLFVLQLLSCFFIPVLLDNLAYLQILWSAFAVLWLLGFQYVGQNRFGVFLRAVFVLGGMTFLAGLTFNGLEKNPLLPLIGFNLALLVIFIISLFCCRRRFTPLRLVQYFMTFTIICGPLFTVALFFYYNVPNILEIWSAFFRFSGIWVLSAMVVLGPFLLFAFYNPCYRQRFDGIFRLQRALPGKTIHR